MLSCSGVTIAVETQTLQPKTEQPSEQRLKKTRIKNRVYEEAEPPSKPVKKIPRGEDGSGPWGSQDTSEGQSGSVKAVLQGSCLL